MSKPRANAEEHLEAEVEGQPVERAESPATVYLTAVGACSIEASRSGGSGYESQPEVWQSFRVAKDPAERITFTSTPSNVAVGGSYDPVVRSSAAMRVSFFTTTPAVCTIAPRDAAVSFVGVGTCWIGVTARRNPGLRIAPGAPVLQGPPETNYDHDTDNWHKGS